MSGIYVHATNLPCYFATDCKMITRTNTSSRQALTELVRPSRLQEFRNCHALLLEQEQVICPTSATVSEIGVLS